MSDHRTLVEIDGLTIGFPNRAKDRMTPVVRDVSFTIRANEILGLVGESGSGKTQTSMALLGLTRPPGKVMAGAIRYGDRDIVAMSDSDLQEIRGARVAMIFQSPRTSLNPLMTIGAQLDRVQRRARGLKGEPARAASLEMLRRVGIAGPERVYKAYPHQLSGGMAQRVMIGMMVACGAELLIADEPTTGLDVTIQAQIFELIQEVRAETGMSVLLITHDLGVVAEVCDRVAVMQSGRIVEIAPVQRLFAEPVHPYTRKLLGAILRPDAPVAAAADVAPPAEVVPFTAGGRAWDAVSVDAWQRLQVAAPELVAIDADHLVLGHPAGSVPS
jgi:ABC-type dipeptide/oligopeptide/nickel transport system ATPase component